jgi:sec-independent protein translocase protein TatC
MGLPRRLSPHEGLELVGHLEELRTRLVISLVALAAGFGVAYAVHGRLLNALTSALPEGHRRPVTFGVAEPFTTSVKLSLVAGFALALPIILWQLWGFLAPALDVATQRAIAAFVLFATVLFAVGVGFGYLIALPAALKFLVGFDATHYTILIRAQDYISFAITVLAAVGIVFELPVFVLALVRIGVLTSTKLRRNRRVGYVLVAVLAVALPGVDPVTTTLEMIPLMALFELSIWMSVFFERRWRSTADLAIQAT